MTPAHNANNPDEYQQALEKVQELHAHSAESKNDDHDLKSSEKSHFESGHTFVTRPEVTIDEVIAGDKTHNTRLGRSLFAPLILFFTSVPLVACYLYLFTFIEPLARLDIAWVFFSFIALVLLCGYCLLLQARIVIMRLRDAGKRQALGVLWFIPFFAPGLFVYLLGHPSQPFENAYGTPNQKKQPIRQLLQPLILAR